MTQGLSRKRAVEILRKAIFRKEIFYKDKTFQLAPPKKNWGDVLERYSLSKIAETISKSFSMNDLTLKGLSGKTAEEVNLYVEKLDLSKTNPNYTNKGVYFQVDEKLKQHLIIEGFNPKEKVSSSLKRNILVVSPREVFELQKFGLIFPKDMPYLDAYIKDKAIFEAKKDIKEKTKLNLEHCHIWNKDGEIII